MVLRLGLLDVRAGRTEGKQRCIVQKQFVTGGFLGYPLLRGLHLLLQYALSALCGGETAVCAVEVMHVVVNWQRLEERNVIY